MKNKGKGTRSTPSMDAAQIYQRWNASQSISRNQVPPDTDNQSHVSRSEAAVIDVGHIYRNWNAQLSA